MAGVNPARATLKRRSMTREEVTELAKLASDLTAAHGRRNTTSANATLGEEDAIWRLRYELNRLAKETGHA